MHISKICGYTAIKNAYEQMRCTFPDLENIYEEYLKKISRTADVFCVKTDKEKVCGFLAMYNNDSINHIAYITLIGIDEKYRKHHIGSMLLSKGIEFAKTQGMTQIRLEVNKSNETAIKFYKKHEFEFENVATEKSFYMRKILL